MLGADSPPPHYAHYLTRCLGSSATPTHCGAPAWAQWTPPCGQGPYWLPNPRAAIPSPGAQWPDGTLYGTTFSGGLMYPDCSAFGCGTRSSAHPARPFRKQSARRSWMRSKPHKGKSRDRAAQRSAWDSNAQRCRTKCASWELRAYLRNTLPVKVRRACNRRPRRYWAAAKI